LGRQPKLAGPGIEFCTQRRAGENVPDASTHMSSTTVFLFDDHTVLRQGVSALLADIADIDVIADRRTASADTDEVARVRPDVVVLGLSKPDCGRIGTARALREKSPHTRVVIFASYGDAEYLFRAFDAGADGYVLKESAVSELVTAIRAVNRGRRYVCAGMQRYASALDALNEHVSPLERLSDRERQLVRMLADGFDRPRIAEALGLSPKSVETYRSRVLKKLGLRDTTALVKFAIEHQVTAAA
jgi:DNA-binding NarL/FixJ family response regulator